MTFLFEMVEWDVYVCNWFRGVVMEVKVKEYEFYYELRLLPFVQAIYLYGSRARQSKSLSENSTLR